ncbi:hypothetical protein ILYODFUR_027161 [Ilyodon furcidens]|uniref:Uncharacterized protein n=1 Tax=Ilyodon furcidens TaxID=33524 RepID=A0ABV0TCX5_9TELE
MKSECGGTIREMISLILTRFTASGCESLLSVSSNASRGNFHCNSWRFLKDQRWSPPPQCWFTGHHVEEVPLQGLRVLLTRNQLVYSTKTDMYLIHSSVFGSSEMKGTDLTLCEKVFTP